MGNNLIKLVQSKRSNGSGANKNQGQCTQRNGNNSNGMPVAESSYENQHSLSSPIFKLNGHCFDELFEYLSLKDLHSLSQTCKSMQKMTGEFFTRNYSAAKFNCLSDGIYIKDNESVGFPRPHGIDMYIPVSGFKEFITWIAIENIIFTRCKKTNKLEQQRKFEYFKLYSDEFKSVKKFFLRSVRLNKRIVGYILKILPNIEVLELDGCTVNQDLYDLLLKYCKNLRSIKLTAVTFKNKNKYKWLLKQYEKLERLELDVHTQDSDNRIDELGTFFERNPKIRNFSCDSSTLMSNKDAFLNSKVKLDAFEVKEFSKYGISDNIAYMRHTPVWHLLQQLHTHGFYKRLHMNAWRENSYLERYTHKYHLIDNFEPLSIHMIEYGEVDNFFCDYLMESGKSKNEFFAKRLTNVERLYFF